MEHNSRLAPRRQARVRRQKRLKQQQRPQQLLDSHLLSARHRDLLHLVDLRRAYRRPQVDQLRPAHARGLPIGRLALKKASRRAEEGRRYKFAAVLDWSRVFGLELGLGRQGQKAINNGGNNESDDLVDDDNERQRHESFEPRGPQAWRPARALSLLLLLFPLLLLGHFQGSVVSAERMVRLCIASVDPAKLSSQCVMCNRREFPLTVIDCTGITKVNDLIANPLSVQEAKCLIYNCRRQVPHIKPEPYHGAMNNAANYRATAAGSSYQQEQQLPDPLALASPFTGSGTRVHEMMAPPSAFATNFGHPNAYGASQQAMGPDAFQMPFASRYGYASAQAQMIRPPLDAFNPQTSSSSAMGSSTALRRPRGLIGGPAMMSLNGQQALPYALVPAPSTGLLPFGPRKYKAALVPLF